MLQAFSVNRTASFEDVLRNQLGALVGCLFFFSSTHVFQRRLKIYVLIGVVCVLGLVCWPAFQALVDEQRAIEQFPVLSDFETCFEQQRWSRPDLLKQINNPVRHGRHAMRIQLTTEHYSGTQLEYFPHDWSGYGRLHFSVFKPDGKPMILYGRLHDQEHRQHGRAYKDRYNREFTVNTGWNDFSISLDEARHAPEGREMNMRKIEGFALFVISQSQPRVLYLDHVYLSK